MPTSPSTGACGPRAQASAMASPDMNVSEKDTAASLPRHAPPRAESATPGPTRVAFDACCFVGNATGIANYVARLLTALCASHPEVEFFGYSNDEALLPELANLTLRVSTPRRRGPVWQNTQVIDMIEADRIDVYWGTNGVT